MRKWAVLTLLGLLCASSGCGVTGTWRFQEIWPESAGSQFRMHEVTLRKDGSATIHYQHRAEPVEATYEFGGTQLVFKSREFRDGLRADAKLTDLDLGLVLTFESMEGMVEVTFRRVE